MNDYSHQIREQGASLYFTVIIMGVVLAMALGLSTLSFKAVKITGRIGKSPVAFYAADSGIERELELESGTGTPPYSECLDLNGGGCSVNDCPDDLSDFGDACYEVTVISPGVSGCPSVSNYCIKSIGFYKKVRRAIRVVR